MTTVTDSERNVPGEVVESPDNEKGGHYKDRAPVRSHAGLRLDPAEPAEDPVPVERSNAANTVTVRTRMWRYVRALGRRLHTCSPYTDRPASIRDVVRHTFAGDWIPGDRSWWLESLGYAYGILIAIPVAVLASTLQWVAHKKRRALTVLVIIGLLHWAGYLWIIQRPCGWFGHALTWLSLL